MARRLTELQRQILLAMLEAEEECSGKPFSQIFGNTIAPQTVAWKILTRRLRQQGVEASNAELWMDQMISIGLETVESTSKMLRSLVENVKRAMRKLAARNILLESLWKAKGRPMVRYTLSPIGRSLAKTLRFREKCDSEKGRGELIEAALNRLREAKRKEEPAYATIDEILEELMQTSTELYGVGRDAVEKYWTKKKLGAELKKRGYRFVYKIVNGKLEWVYNLICTFDEELDELKRVLESIGLWSVSMRDIRAALWKVCGHKFESKEAFEKEWSERKIGRMMKKLGAKRYLKWHMGQKGAREWYYDLRPVFPEKWPTKIALVQTTQSPFSFHETLFQNPHQNFTITP